MTICRASAVERRVGMTTYCQTGNHTVSVRPPHRQGAAFPVCVFSAVSGAAAVVNVEQQGGGSHQQDVGHDGPVHGQEGLSQEDEDLPTGNASQPHNHVDWSDTNYFLPQCLR